jgi:AraC-like DNA-binding protein
MATALRNTCRHHPAPAAPATFDPRFVSESARQTLHSSGLVRVENAYLSALQHPPSGYETGYQVVLPYLGLFAYKVGSKRWLIDSNKTLFISPGWEFADEHPVRGLGHAAVLINPSRGLLEEICSAPGPNRSPAFLATTLPSTARLNFLTQSLLHTSAAECEPLVWDEWVLRVLQEAMNVRPKGKGRASAAVARAKEVLHAHRCERISLQDVARQAGVSAVYLTQEFTRAECGPLYQYQLRLRLSQALLELPHCDDITGLALDLGFYSHSHFTSMFRKTFGVTPSQYRARPGTLCERLWLADRCMQRPAARRRAA